MVCISKEEISKLINKALNMRAFSYAPYSGFKVGAALLTGSGLIYGGCNIENAAYTPTNCAERTAFFKAVSEGQKDFRAIAIVGGKGNEISGYCAPCGVCRQVMREFCDLDFMVILARNAEDYKLFSLKDLFPEDFGPDNL